MALIDFKSPCVARECRRPHQFGIERLICSSSAANRSLRQIVRSDAVRALAIEFLRGCGANRASTTASASSDPAETAAANFRVPDLYIIASACARLRFARLALEPTPAVDNPTMRNPAPETSAR